MTPVVPRFALPSGLPPLRRAINGAVAWRVVAELVRRHQPRFGLRVLETHPGDGQYDCISLTMEADGHPHALHLAAFNLGSGTVTVFHPMGTDGSSEQWRHDYFAEFGVRSDDPKETVDRIEALLALPRNQTLPPLATAARCLRVLATGMEMQVFARDPLRAECAWYDSSGVGGSQVQAWLSTVFPTLAARTEAGPGSNWAAQAGVAARVWRVGDVAVDLATGNVVRFSQPGRTLLLPADVGRAACGS